MKSSSMFSLAVIASLAMSSMAYAQGRGGGQGGASAPGTQSRIHTPGTGLATATPLQTRIQSPLETRTQTPLQTRIHPPGTGLTTPPATPAQGTASTAGRGIHPPGTGR